MSEWTYVDSYGETQRTGYGVRHREPVADVPRDLVRKAAARSHREEADRVERVETHTAEVSLAEVFGGGLRRSPKTGEVLPGDPVVRDEIPAEISADETRALFGIAAAMPNTELTPEQRFKVDERERDSRRFGETVRARFDEIAKRKEGEK